MRPGTRRFFVSWTRLVPFSQANAFGQLYRSLLKKCDNGEKAASKFAGASALRLFSSSVIAGKQALFFRYFHFDN
jgi:hypothetical protein